MMKFKILLIAFLTVVLSARAQEKTIFPKEALTAKLENTKGRQVTLATVLDKHKGKTIVLDVWASWCSDCIKGLPLLQELQKKTEKNDVVYVFLSVDRKQDRWKKAIKERNIVGDHYFVNSNLKNGGMKGALGKAIDLNWIPRYMVVGKNGTIKLYNAIKADDKKIIEAINADK